jgi:hypothetical protein
MPFAILLQIPGLTGHWYIQTADGETTEVQPNPKLLLAGMVISTAAAILANIALIRRFSEHQPREMTLFSIAMLSIHGKIFRHRKRMCLVMFEC